MSDVDDARAARGDIDSRLPLDKGDPKAAHANRGESEQSPGAMNAGTVGEAPNTDAGNMGRAGETSAGAIQTAGQTFNRLPGGADNDPGGTDEGPTDMRGDSDAEG